MNLHVLRATESKKVIFGMSSVCLSVCLSVCGHHNSKNIWASSTKFGMWSYMIKISVGIAYEQNLPTGVASALRAQFGFLGEKWLKNALYKTAFRTKVVINHNTQLLLQKNFGSPHGCGLCPEGTICYFGKKCLKNALYKIFYHTKVVTNQNSQLLGYVTFFDILHHYGVIAASQTCSVLRKYCAVLRNRFFFYICMFVCLYVCLFVDMITLEMFNQIRTKFSHMTFEWNSSAKFEDGHHRSYVTPQIGGFCPPWKFTYLRFQPIQTKFSHMTFDWNSSAEFKNGHHRSHITPLIGGFWRPPPPHEN